jgi:hypothetical protein
MFISVLILGTDLFNVSFAISIHGRHQGLFSSSSSRSSRSSPEQQQQQHASIPVHTHTYNTENVTLLVHPSDSTTAIKTASPPIRINHADSCPHQACCGAIALR